MRKKHPYYYHLHPGVKQKVLDVVGLALIDFGRYMAFHFVINALKEVKAF